MEESIFEHKTLEEIYDEIRSVYLSDDRTWVIGYSGGKDSTTSLQLVWYAISELPKEKRIKPIHIISTDTLVETPVIVDYIEQTLERIEKAAKEQDMPFIAHRLKPELNDTFWVNLIGRGYPAPQRMFRWCTDRLKIKPADKFILEQISKHGSVVLVLGIRKGESMTRAQVMSLHTIKGSVLSRHSTLPNAYVYAPIADWSLNDVWTYLLQTPSPWGNNNRDLVALYKNAQGECPLVIDDTTPSCGNSRFGCWVCTVVKKDRSMESLIDSGEEWMEPMLEFRDFLASTQDPLIKPKIRELKRRFGFVSFRSDGSGEITRGPYKLEFCKELLRKLLETQKRVRMEGPDPNITLISREELEKIREIWRLERGDWEDSLPSIYKEVTGEEFAVEYDDIGVFSKDLFILKEITDKYNLPLDLIKKLIDVEIQYQSISRHSTIYERLEKVLREEWRSEEELLKKDRIGIKRSDEI